MKSIYVLVDPCESLHYGAYAEESIAVEKAREFEKQEGLSKGDILIFEISENLYKNIKNTLYTLPVFV